MTAAEIVDQIKPLGKDSYKSVIMKHGIREPVFGVAISELKKIQKVVKRDYQTALDLYATGIFDAMYLAGLIADDMKMTQADLQNWVEKAYCHTIAENVVAWVASEGRFGQEIGLKWIDSDQEMIADAGWATLYGLLALKSDAELDLDMIKGLLDRIKKNIHTSPNRVRSAMNSYVISVGSYVAPLTSLALATANEIGPVMVDVGDTSCKIASAPERIQKMIDSGSVGKKKKSVKC
ncbi:MAG: DNA alkylation repair protein [Chthonomonadales bacterium]